MEETLKHNESQNTGILQGSSEDPVGISLNQGKKSMVCLCWPDTNGLSGRSWGKKIAQQNKLYSACTIHQFRSSCLQSSYFFSHNNSKY